MSESTPTAGGAFGAPGIPPRWTRGAKDAIGTAYSAASRLWFTLAQGTVTEVYYPTIDQPQMRDLQFLFTDGASFFHTERRDCDAQSEALSDTALGYRITTAGPEGRYRCHKRVIADPHLSCLLLHARVEAEASLRHQLRLYLLCAPHLGGAGSHNNAEVTSVAGQTLLLAHRDNVWMALGASAPLGEASVGYVGASDGWTDLSQHLVPQWRFDQASDGNVAMSAAVELPWQHHGHVAEFAVGIGFGDSRQAAISALLQGIGQPFAAAEERFLEQWQRTRSHRRPLEAQSQDQGALYHRSLSLLLAHEDKTYPGALIASLSIPWGEVKGDEDLGGYHLVWTRDMVQSATGLLAGGDAATPRRALIYLAASQREHGGFAQNFWLNGTPYWQGIQLDETAFPIILAWRMQQHQALGAFDPYPMVVKAAGYLMREGPATQEERWEECGGYSPSTLAAHIAGLVCAAEFARHRGDGALAGLCLDYADFLESHLEDWTVTRHGTLLAGVPRHYIRINPAPWADPGGDEDPDGYELHINNRGPGERDRFPAREIVDAGFLELVRYGVRPPRDPLIEDSLRVVDAYLRISFGTLGTAPRRATSGSVGAEPPRVWGDSPCWRRYNHDGYGQRDDGTAYQGWGRGRPWPLLTGERAHYELACGRDVTAYVVALERQANHLQMLPEQIWDQADVPAQFLHRGRPTGSAMPLMWAHAEYIRLLRSRADGAVFDLIPPVAERYRKPRRGPRLEIWKRSRPIRQIAPGRIRIQLSEPFFLHFSRDGWRTIEEQRSAATPCGYEYVDLTLAPGQTAPLQFTFRDADSGNWEGKDYAITLAR